MIYLKLFIPYFLSLIIGIKLMYALRFRGSMALRVCLGAGLGLGLSSLLTFFSFILFNGCRPEIVIGTHIVILGVLFAICRKNIQEESPNTKKKKSQPNASLWGIILLLFPMFLIGYQATMYPHGGWDAWSVWNLKAKFLYLGNENWRTMFSADLWRSSPHYPLLLPCLNVWLWMCTGEATYLAPLITALLFTFLTASLLYIILRDLTKHRWAILPSLVMLTLPFFHKLSISQYCDIVAGFYLLATFSSLYLFLNTKELTGILLTGLMTGFLSFTKPEGTVSAGLIFLITGSFLLLSKELEIRKKLLFTFVTGALATGIATIIFNLFLSPGNQSFVNGFTSTNQPATTDRLKMIFIMFGMEVFDPFFNWIIAIVNHGDLSRITIKWNGLWLAGIILLLFRLKEIKNAKLNLIIWFLFSYNVILILYYQMNTYFKIQWWMNVTLHRLLFATLPLFLFAIFLSLFPQQEQANKKGR